MRIFLPKHRILETSRSWFKYVKPLKPRKKNTIDNQNNQTVFKTGSIYN